VLKEKILLPLKSLYCVEWLSLFHVCSDGGIGRRAGLKHLWETVPVRLSWYLKSVIACLSSITGFFNCSAAIAKPFDYVLFSSID
jgi:hypothetical protein